MSSINVFDCSVRHTFLSGAAIGWFRHTFWSHPPTFNCAQHVSVCGCDPVESDLDRFQNSKKVSLHTLQFEFRNHKKQNWNVGNFRKSALQTAFGRRRKVAIRRSQLWREHEGQVEKVQNHYSMLIEILRHPAGQWKTHVSSYSWIINGFLNCTGTRSLANFAKCKLSPQR